MKQLQHILLVLLSLFITGRTNSLFAQSKNKLAQEINTLRNDPALKHAVWSVCVINSKDSVIAEYNSQLSVVPASTMKIVTTGAALEMLGANFKFATKLSYDGVFDSIKGIIKGNLYIVGGGDPSLGSGYFKDKKDSLTIVEKWAAILKQKGIKQIDGAVIADAGIFEDNMVPGQWIWGDIGNYFGAGANGLSYNDNKYTVYYNSGAEGSITTVNKIVPEVKGLLFNNYVTAGGKGDNAVIYGSPYSNVRFAEGTIPANKTNYEVEGSLPDPSLFCAQALHDALKNSGISISEKPGTVKQLKDKNEYALANRKVLHTHYSPTLDKIVYYTNLKSDNLYAEHLLKYMAYHKKGTGKETDGIEIVKNFWKAKGVDISGFSMNDGCGLSRANVITTKTQAQILRSIAKEKTFFHFYNSLPVAGKSGSLGGLCEGTVAENNLRAKSGYITGARGYCGYVKNKKGEQLSFSVLANNYECSPTEMKRKLEKILVAIAGME